jgi:hypothetical protein
MMPVASCHYRAGRHLSEHRLGTSPPTSHQSPPVSTPPHHCRHSTPPKLPPPWRATHSEPLSRPTPQTGPPSTPHALSPFPHRLSPPTRTVGGELPCFIRGLYAHGQADCGLGLARLGPKCIVHFVIYPMN